MVGFMMYCAAIWFEFVFVVRLVLVVGLLVIVILCR